MFDTSDWVGYIKYEISDFFAFLFIILLSYVLTISIEVFQPFYLYSNIEKDKSITSYHHHLIKTDKKC